MANIYSVDGLIMRTQMGMAVNDYVSNIPNMSAYELGHDVGFVSEKVVEIALVSRGSSLTVNALKNTSGMINGVPKVLNPKNYQLLKKPLVFRKLSLKKGLGETTFQIVLRYKPTNFMIRLERHSANLMGGGRTYYTHFNTFPFSRLNHFGLNPLKWGKIKY
jgi:hypothetical protein